MVEKIKKEINRLKEYYTKLQEEKAVYDIAIFFADDLLEYIEKLEEESVPQHSYSETIYHVGKEPRWKIGDNLAYYQFYSDYEGEYDFGKITNVEFNEEYEDWYYTFEDGDTCSEEELIREEAYKKK